MTTKLTGLDAIAQQLFDAQLKRDWSLVNHLKLAVAKLIPSAQQAINRRWKELAEEYAQANPPTYFN